MRIKGGQHADMQVQTKGEFGGLGIEVTMEDGLVKDVPIDVSMAPSMCDDLPVLRPCQVQAGAVLVRTLLKT